MEGGHKVTLAIYSGRPDPVWTVHLHHEKHKEMKELLDSARAKKNTYRHEHMPACLGFKGFLVHHPEAEDAEFIVGKETAPLQKLLLDTMPEGLITETLRQKVLKAITSGAVSAKVPDATQLVSPQVTSKVPSKPEKAVVGSIPHYAPKLNLARWNTYYLIRGNNNCYNYANGKITNSFAQPGYASGFPFPYDITVNNVLNASLSDGLVKMDVDPSAPCPKAPAQPNCLVALFVAEGLPPHADFHWYRLDDNGYWSQKPGPTAATNLDGAGQLISDPRKAANNPYGPDYKFVTFMKIFTNIIDGPPRIF